MPKRTPLHPNDHGLTHPQEMLRRKAERRARIPRRETRQRTQLITDPLGAVHLIPHITMFDGIRVNAAGLPRSRTYRYTPTNFHGEPRR